MFIINDCPFSFLRRKITSGNSGMKRKYLVEFGELYENSKKQVESLKKLKRDVCCKSRQIELKIAELEEKLVAAKDEEEEKLVELKIEPRLKNAEDLFAMQDVMDEATALG